jgi:outer membrane lipase/esterase
MTKTPSSLLLAATLLFAANAAQALPFSNLVVFGDSISDAGNAFIASGGTIPDPTYYTNPGHFTNGQTYAEIMWTTLGFSGSLQPSLSPTGGTDFAFAGARSRYGSTNLVDNGFGTLVPPPIGTPAPPSPDSFVGQINSYLGLTGNVADPGALYIGWTGGNDVRDIAVLTGLGQTAEAQALFNQSIADVASALSDLIAAGARNLLVPTVTDLGLTPEAQAQGPAAAAFISAQSQLYNEAIDQALLAFTGVAGLDLTRADTFDFLGEVVADPAAFGISNATDPCLDGFFVDEQTGSPITTCATPETYAFWDIIHPGSRLHEVLAAGFIAAVPAPMSLPLLMLGLAGIVVLRRSATAS